MISKISISKKLLLLTGTFLIILLIYNVLIIKNSYETYNASINAQNGVKLIRKNNNLIHLLQIERGLSIGVLSGDDNSNLLINRANLDKLIDDITLKTRVDNIRTRVDNKENKVSILKEYTKEINKLLNNTQDILSSLDDSYIDYDNAINIVAKTKEKYALLRGNLNGVFLTNYMEIATFSNISYLNISIENKLRELRALKLDFINKKLDSINKLDENIKFQDYLNTAINKNINGGFNIDSKDFFNTATKLIKDYKDLEDLVIERMINKANLDKQNTKNSIIIQIALALLAQGINMLLAYIISKNIIINLERINKGLDSFFDFLRYKSDDVTAIKTNNKDEFGKMATQINSTVNELKENYKKDETCINEITKITNEIKCGRLDNEIYTVPNNPKIKELKNILEEMLQTLKRKIGSDINKINELLNEFANMNFINNISNPTGEIENNLNTLQIEIKNMLFLQESISSSLKNNSDELKQNMNKLINGSNNAKNNLEESAAAINQMSNSMNAISNKSSEVITQSNNIKSIIDIIKQIAEDTSLLALNAAIEAARAGEHGRGFSVVASEVSKLANNTNSSLNQIEANVKLLVQQIYDIDKSIDEQTKAVKLINENIHTIDNLNKNNDFVASATNTAANNVDKLASDIYEELKKKKFH